MRTMFHTPPEYADQFRKIAENFPCNSPVKPERFKKKMLENQGSITRISGMEQEENGLERRNPIIVALGDSVTADHYDIYYYLPRFI